MLEKKRDEEIRRVRMEKKQRLEEKWRMVRWLTSYIEENQERWEIQKREDELRRKIREWDKSERFRKIEIIKKNRESEEKRHKIENGEPENKS